MYFTGFDGLYTAYEAVEDLLEDFCSVDPKRLIPIGVVPTDDGEKAIAG